MLTYVVYRRKCNKGTNRPKGRVATKLDVCQAWWMAGSTITLTFGRRLRHAREAAGLKQSDLAVHLGVARTTITSWENDEVRPAIIYRREFARMFPDWEPEFFIDLEPITFDPVTEGYPHQPQVVLHNAA
jgi:DNA-binding XRE family transcriptional regulator